MTTETTLKNERISETNIAANTTGNKAENNASDKSTIIKDAIPLSTSSKNKEVYMVAFPVVFGSVGIIGGSMIAKKLGKNKKVFIVSGLLIGLTLGYFIHKVLDKKNTNK